MGLSAKSMDSITKTMELIRRAQGGEPEALDRICRRYYERIRIPVRLRLGAKLRRRLDTDDILQGVFLSLIKDFDRFEMRDEGSLLHYLSKVAVHEICARADQWGADKCDLDREVPLVPRGSDGETSDQGRALSPDSDPMLEKLVKSERTEILEECLAELREDYREVILQRDFLGLSWKQIAENLGKNTESAARECRARALVELSRLLLARGVHEDRTES